MAYRHLALVLLVGGLAQTLGAETVLRTEYQDTQPKFIRDRDGRLSGLCIEIQSLIEKHSDFRFSSPVGFVPISRITQDLTSGAIDAYFGLAKTPQREKDFVFVGELFQTRYQILARKGDPALEFSSVAQLRDSGLPIMVIRGGAPATYYQSTLSLPVTDAPTSVEIALRQLRGGSGRLFGYYDLGNEWYLDRLGYRTSLEALPLVLDLDAQWLTVSRALPAEVAARLSRTLDEVKATPEWAALMAKYFPGR